MKKFSTIIVLLLCFLQFIPPLFTKGEIFDHTYRYVDVYGKGVTVHGVYADNVYYTILYFLFTFLGLAIPYLTENISRVTKYISTALGAWFASGMVYELFNYYIPLEVVNSNPSLVFSHHVIFFTIGLIFIATHEMWLKAK